MQILDHSKCKFSSDLAGDVTAGQGLLNAYGEWTIPCETCRLKAEALLEEDKNAHSSNISANRSSLP